MNYNVVDAWVVLVRQIKGTDAMTCTYRLDERMGQALSILQIDLALSTSAAAMSHMLVLLGSKDRRLETVDVVWSVEFRVKKPIDAGLREANH